MNYRRVSLIALLWLLSDAAAASTDRLYKWTDAQGQVHYSDRVPPEAARHGREVKSSRGLTLERVEAAKPREQLEAERMAREQEEARRLAEVEAQRRQEAADRTLLLTFSSTTDIERARDDRIAVIDGQITLTQARIDGLQDRLQQARQQAATAERTGRGDLMQLHQRISGIERQIAEHNAFISNKQRERQQLIKHFAADLARYRELRAQAAEQ